MLFVFPGSEIAGVQTVGIWVAAEITAKTGELVTSFVLTDEEELMVISKKGQVIRVPIEGISVLSRPTQGVRIMRMDDGDKVASAICI